MWFITNECLLTNILLIITNISHIENNAILHLTVIDNFKTIFVPW